MQEQDLCLLLYLIQNGKLLRQITKPLKALHRSERFYQYCWILNTLSNWPEAVIWSVTFAKEIYVITVCIFFRSWKQEIFQNFGQWDILPCFVRGICSKDALPETENHSPHRFFRFCQHWKIIPGSTAVQSKYGSLLPTTVLPLACSIMHFRDIKELHFFYCYWRKSAQELLHEKPV